MSGVGWLFGIDLLVDHRGVAPRPGLLEKEMHSFAHAPFVVISAMKNSMVSGPLLVEPSFTGFLISARLGAEFISLK